MRLTDIDAVRRRSTNELYSDRVEFKIYIYNECLLQEEHFESISELLNFLALESENDTIAKSKSYWIEVINRSCCGLPNSIKILCEHFDIHPLTMEDIATLTPYMKLNLFRNSGALYLLMKMLTWNGQCIEQQQISFYLNCSQNLLITFQEESPDNAQPCFQMIRHRLRRQQLQTKDNNGFLHCRLRQLNVDYLLYCLLDAIIDRYVYVMEEIAIHIGDIDESLMNNEQARTLTILHQIYHLKHDLLHVRILFNPLKEIMSRLQRTTSDDENLAFPRKDPTLRLGLKHRIVRRKTKILTTVEIINTVPMKPESVFLNDYMYIYLNDLNNRFNEVIDSLEIQRESVSILISFWITLTSNQTQATLKFLMMISVLCMPCNLLTAVSSTNFHTQPQLKLKYGYCILWCCLGLILISMTIWYKIKRWI